VVSQVISGKGKKEGKKYVISQIIRLGGKKNNKKI
jgi:hypothetical protein